MLVEAKNLQIGDEVLIGCQGDLRLAKLLRVPKLSKKLNWRGEQYYTATKCTIFTKQVEYQYMRGTTPVKYFRTESDLSKSNDTKEMNINFNGRQIYLIYREND